MNRSTMYVAFAILLGVGMIVGRTLADDASQAASGKNLGEAELAEQLRGMLVAQTEAKQKEDLAGTIENLDPRLTTKYITQFRQIFRTFDLRYTLDAFKLLYHDDEIAVTRVKQTLKKVAGPDFKDNQRDALQIFRKRDGQWKIFEQVILDRTILKAAPKTAPSASPTKEPDSKPGKEN